MGLVYAVMPLLRRCWCIEAADLRKPAELPRLVGAGVLQHPWFAGVGHAASPS